MQKVTLGGDRLGSGNKNKIALRNYERSTHDLSAKFTSSLQCGVLYPFSVIPAMRGDTFTIDVAADARTIPTKGPLFGSFKMQIDYFQCPFRLYQAILHNNPLAIGLKMSQVKLPRIKFSSHADVKNDKVPVGNNCLLKYLGISGIGHAYGNNTVNAREFNAVPVLAYYEIFKTYYSNKQEENAFVISGTSSINDIEPLSIHIDGSSVQPDTETTVPNERVLVEIQYEGNATIEEYIESVSFTVTYNEGSETTFSLKDLNDFYKNVIGIDVFECKKDGYSLLFYISKSQLKSDIQYYEQEPVESIEDISFSFELIKHKSDERLRLTPFKLANIDDMRLAILSKHSLGFPFMLNDDDSADWNTESGTDQTGLPYSCLFTTQTENGLTKNLYPLNGLVVKTYQSDLYNNWVKTEWIDGDNGISAITAINTSSGSFTIDTLNLSEKLYNMLNRVAVSDGSYEGWQDAVYTESPKRHIESPVYLGGASNEIVFEEIVQTSQTTDASPLGSLGGKGRLIKRKGGHIHVKVDEASFIIGIVSLTPRINYTQGNEWYMTDLWSLDDLHKPALDGIGFENLIGERLAYWDTAVDSNGDVSSRHVIGKVPAWINYMTRVDKGYGDFAETDGNGFMLLQRNYEKGNNGTIKDATTYIDPEKYNYAFAYRGLDAQNFWVQIYENVIARRLMSAKQIPNI